MCSSARFDSDVPDWLRSLLALVWKHRAAAAPVVALAVTLVGLAGGLFYLFSPTDVERAEADVQKARAVVMALDDESVSCQKDARLHQARAAEFRKLADDNRDTTDTAWLDWHRAMADSHSQLRRAKSARRDNLYHLTAEYLRLLAEAECEILRAKDARDRGTPYKVAPRVRELLTPMISAR